MAEVVIRPARPGDAPAIARHFAAVAEEGDGTATAPPVDVAEEGLRPQQNPRANGELWDAIVMGLVLRAPATTAP